MLESIVSNISFLHVIGFAVAFILTLLLISVLKRKLPVDQGRKNAVEGQLSQGKARGAGIIFTLVAAFTVCIFSQTDAEHYIYLLLIIFSMLSGFFDDAASKPWNPYVKGAIDLIIAVGAALTYVIFNEGDYGIMTGWPVWLIVIIGAGVVWASINSTNCTDGVDGLSATLSIITLSAAAVLHMFGGGMSYTCVVFIAVLMAYLLFNANPSTVLMGDAGSRALGTLIAILFLTSGNVFAWLFCGFVFIVDGGVGIIKLGLARFLKIRIFKNVRFPLHDHVRKNLGWSNTQTVFRFAVIQAFLCIAGVWMLLMGL